MTDCAENNVEVDQEKVGFVVKFETVVTLHQCALFEGEEETDSGGDGDGQPSASFYWEVLQYGMPVIIANSNGVAFCLADIESGDKICEFPVWSSSQYVTVDGHFHIIAEPSGCYGISFDDSAIGKKVLVLLKRAVSYPSFKGGEEGVEPSAKQRRIEDDSADGSDDEVDGPFGKRRLKKKRSIDISEPKGFEHLSHVGVDASISQLTQAMSWTDTLKRRHRRTWAGGDCPIEIPVYNCKEIDTVSTTSFVEVKAIPPPGPPPGPPPPPAPPPPAVAPPPAKVVIKKKHSTTSSTGGNDLMSSLANELKKGVVLKPVGADRSSISSQSSSRKSFDSLQEELKSGVVLKSLGNSSKVMTLPPPPRRNQSEKLLFEISTFRRTKLRHIASATNMTDFPSANDKSLESVMKRGFDTMMKKLSGLDISNVVSVSKEGNDNFNILFPTAE